MFGPESGANARVSPKAGARGKVVSPDRVRRTIGGVPVWCAAAGAAAARKVRSVAVRLIVVSPGLKVGHRRHARRMPGRTAWCCTRHRASMHGTASPRARPGRPCYFALPGGIGKGFKKSWVVSEGFASPAALVVDAHAGVLFLLSQALPGARGSLSGQVATRVFISS